MAAVAIICSRNNELWHNCANLWFTISQVATIGHMTFLLFSCSHHGCTRVQIFWTWCLGGWYSVLNFQGCAANMGSKISLLVYEWPLTKCKIWYMNGSIFQNFPKFEPKLVENYRKWKLWKNGVILLKIWHKIGPIGIWMGHFFFEKLVFPWVYFQIPQRHIPTKTKLEYPLSVVST